MARTHAPYGKPTMAGDAEAVAIAGLRFLAGEPERLERFLSLAGLSPDTLREAAGTPGFLSAVLDHIAADESLLFAFAETEGLTPAGVESARVALGRVVGYDFGA